jgi:N-acetylneuraminic acid mutarotase
MNEPRKNSSACALTTDTIYIFGGTSQHACSDTIEQYSIATNTWNLLKIRLPSPISFTTSFKLSCSQILLMGGSVKEHSKRA